MFRRNYTPAPMAISMHELDINVAAQQALDKKKAEFLADKGEITQCPSGAESVFDNQRYFVINPITNPRAS